jgi:hypothetical protein
MLAVVAPPTKSPVNVALLIVVVGAVVTKSSVVSVSIFAGACDPRKSGDLTVRIARAEEKHVGLRR